MKKTHESNRATAEFTVKKEAEANLPTEFGHFRITYVGGNRVVNVPTIPDHHLLGECCLFKLSIPGECSLVVSSIQF